MNPKNQRRVTAEEMLEQTRRNRLRSAILESRSGPVLPENAILAESDGEIYPFDFIVVCEN